MPKSSTAQWDCTQIRNPAAAPFIKDAQEVLRLAGITDIVDDPRNLTWALNWDHSLDYAKAVDKVLRDAWEAGMAKGGKAEATKAVERALRKIEKVLNKGTKFRG